MRIVKLKAENVKRLKAVEITPTGDMVIISGANEQGKSSLLDSIMYTLAGKRAIPSKPIREGQTKAEVVVETETFIATRKITPKGSTLTVTTKKGMKYPSPQKFLDGLIGQLSFDPLEFSRMAGPDRRQALITLAGMEGDLADWQDSHTELLRALRDAEQVSRMKEAAAVGDEPKKDDPTVFVSQEKLWAEYELVCDKERRISDISQKVKLASQEHAHNLTQFQKAKNQLDEAKEAARNSKATLAELKRKADDNPPLSEVLAGKAACKQAQEKAQAHNDIVQANKDWRGANRAAGDAALKVIEVKESVSESLSLKTKILEDAKMPLPKLSMVEGEVTYDGIPYDQLADSQKLKVSVAMAMAANPDLRVIRINDGSLLDSKSLSTIAKMAKKKDYQIWVEIVDESGELGFVIEDGSLKSGGA